MSPSAGGVKVFQSAPPCEGATRETQAMSRTTWSFNPRPRVRGRPGVDRPAGSERKFQSAPPCEGATSTCSFVMVF